MMRSKLLVLGILFCAAVCMAGARQWVPNQIGEGAFRLQPDQTLPYKTVDKKGESTELTLSVFLPEGHQRSDQRPAIIFFHGGGWYGGSPDHLYPQSRYFALRGLVVISAQYRTINEFGTSPKECVADGKSAMRWVRGHAAELGIDPARIAAGGGSAGGHIAAAAALCDGFDELNESTEVSCRPDALLLYNPVFDNGPNGFAHSLVQPYWKQISPINNIDEHAPPTIVFLGTEDEFIPVETAKKFKSLMQENEVRCDLHLYEDKPHGFYNLWTSREDLAVTLVEIDRFLISLGYLKGEPILTLNTPME